MNYDADNRNEYDNNAMRMIGDEDISIVIDKRTNISY